jgi:hypothetical protein
MADTHAFAVGSFVICDYDDLACPEVLLPDYLADLNNG